MIYIIALLIVTLVGSFVLITFLYIAISDREGHIRGLEQESQRLNSIHTHLLVQLGEEGFTVKKCWSDSVSIKLIKEPQRSKTNE